MVTQLPDNGKIRLAIVTGGHPFDVRGFRDLFGQMADVDPYVQDVDNWVRSQVFDQYDAFLFFNMHAWGIYSVRKDMDERIIDAIERLGKTEQGIFVMHHAILSWPDSETWSNICNMDNRSLRAEGHGFTSSTDIIHDVVAVDHPITQNLGSWTLTTEGFQIGDARSNSQVFLATNNPDSSRTLAWTHHYGNARVLSYIIGHDASDWYDPNYMTVLHRGIQWVSNRL